VTLAALFGVGLMSGLFWLCCRYRHKSCGWRLFSNDKPVIPDGPNGKGGV
jgi:hypothetical protein